jgi:hypothetical protein
LKSAVLHTGKKGYLWVVDADITAYFDEIRGGREKPDRDKRDKAALK